MNRKSRTVALFILLLSLASASCTETKTPRQESTQTTQQEVREEEIPDAYAFSVNGTVLYPDMDITTLPQELGEPDGMFEEESCAALGTARLYAWHDYEIFTYPDGERDRIQYIYLKTDAVQTAEGADLASTRSEIEALYGPGGEGSDETKLVYPRGSMCLVFAFDADGYPASIEYRSDVMK